MPACGLLRLFLHHSRKRIHSLLKRHQLRNLLSLRRAFEHCGASVVVSDDPQVLLGAPRLVLPGVGVRMIPFLLRFAPRSLVLASVARVQQKR